MQNRMPDRVGVNQYTTAEEDPGNYPGPLRGENRDLVAKQAGFSSTDEYRRASKVVDDGVPELVEAMDAVSVSATVEVASPPSEEQTRAVRAGPAAPRTLTEEQRRGVAVVGVEHAR